MGATFSIGLGLCELYHHPVIDSSDESCPRRRPELTSGGLELYRNAMCRRTERGLLLYQSLWTKIDKSVFLLPICWFNAYSPATLAHMLRSGGSPDQLFRFFHHST